MQRHQVGSYRTLEEGWSALCRFFPALSLMEQQVSLALYAMLAEGRPVPVEILARATGLEAQEVEKILSRWPGLYRDACGRITGHWGMSVVETPHRLAFTANAVYASCAWDALLIPHALGAGAQVQSRCAMTGMPIMLDVGPHGAEAAGSEPVLSFIAPGLCDTAGEFARKLFRFVHFFVDEVAASEWSARHPGTFLMSLHAAWELGRRRNEARYRGRWESSFAVF